MTRSRAARASGVSVSASGQLAGAVLIGLVAAACSRAGPEPVTIHRYACPPTSSACVQSYAVRLTDLDGPRVALYTMKALQIEGRIAHSVDGYQLAYAVGRETAKRFGKGAVGLCPTTFNDGCAHGFVDALAEP